MRLVSIITGRLTYTVGFIFIFQLCAFAQVNSPFSRYGIGNLTGSQHIISRGMGGLQAAYADGMNNNVGQSVNFNNPATYGSFYMISYDLGLSIDSRNLKSNNPTGSFSSIYFIPSYVAVGLPINKAKGLGVAFGLRPISRINYSIITKERVLGDSLGTNYQGSGGLNQAFIGIGKKWKKLNIGVNTGYNFGRKEITTEKTFFNDTIKYYQSNSISQTNFGKMFLQLGLQYEITLKKKENTAQKSTENYLLRFGATATLQQKLNATQKLTRQTFGLSASGSIIEIDSIFKQDDIKGKVEIPATYEAGMVFHKTLSSARGVFELWSLGVEYTSTQWTKYRFYGQPEALSNSWMMKLGAQISPNPLATGNYLSNINYRFGFHIGKDYINADGNGLKTIGLSIGAGLPIRKWRAYETQYTVIQTALQFGKRGSSVNNITENYAQFSVGFSLSDVWFIKRRYD
jgi:hypothetical protein